MRPLTDITQKKALKAIIIFFAVMLIITLIARAVNAAVMPTVSITKVFSAQITKAIKASASITLAGGENLLLPEGILIEKSYLSVGERVKAGDCIALLSLSELTFAETELRANIKILQTQADALTTPIEPDSYSLKQAQAYLDEAYMLHAKAVENGVVEEINAALSAAQNAEASRNSALHSFEQAKKAAFAQDSQNKADAQLLNSQITKKSDELKELVALIKQNGQILSPTSGIITSYSLTQGALTQRTGAIISDENSSMLVKGSVKSESADKLSVGMSLTLTQGKLSESAEISAVEVNTLGEAIFTAMIKNSSLTVGKADAQIIISSDRYEICVPLQAVRQDINGNFVYTIEKHQTVLGESNVLIRTSVDVIEKDNSVSAVTGALSSTDLIVNQANKPVSVGARVKTE